MAALALSSTAIALQLPSAHVPATAAADSQWIRPHNPGDPLIWGRKDGIVFGLPSTGGLLGPRGLIRVGVLSAKTGKTELLN